MTCGSVDGGKSTLIGRLLFETNLIKEDQLAHLRNFQNGMEPAMIKSIFLSYWMGFQRKREATIDIAYLFQHLDKKLQNRGCART